MESRRHTRLFRDGGRQALRIPRGLELDADEAIVRRDGERLVLEPIRHGRDLKCSLTGWGPLAETIPDVDEGLLPLDDVRL